MPHPATSHRLRGECSRPGRFGPRSICEVLLSARDPTFRPRPASANPGLFYSLYPSKSAACPARPCQPARPTATIINRAPNLTHSRQIPALIRPRDRGPRQRNRKRSRTAQEPDFPQSQTGCWPFSLTPNQCPGKYKMRSNEIRYEGKEFFRLTACADCHRQGLGIILPPGQKAISRRRK